jgi:hypothetical protein
MGFVAATNLSFSKVVIVLSIKLIGQYNNMV